MILAGALLLLGCGAPTVVRVIDGRPVEGRFISEYAYALYAIAADAEAHGDTETALEAFKAAATEDEDSPEIWTRIGALRCRTGAGAAEEAFNRAHELDPEYEPLRREQAQCALARGRLAEALEHAARAVDLDPEADETALLHASILERMNRRPEALREIRAIATRRPTSPDAWRQLHDFAVRMGDQATAEQALQRLSRLTGPAAAARFGGLAARQPLHSTPTPPEAAPTATQAPAPPEGASGSAEGAIRAIGALDAALAAGDLAKARRLSRRARMSPSEIAVRAAALGRGAVAREQAELVLGADPSDGSARIALAVAADLVGDRALLTRAMSDMPPASPGAFTSPSPLARLLFAELLDRWAGLTAARAWLGPWTESAREGARQGAELADPPRPRPTADALLVKVEERVRGRLGG